MRISKVPEKGWIVSCEESFIALQALSDSEWQKLAHMSGSDIEPCSLTFTSSNTSPISPQTRGKSNDGKSSEDLRPEPDWFDLSTDTIDSSKREIITKSIERRSRTVCLNVRFSIFIFMQPIAIKLPKLNIFLNLEMLLTIKSMLTKKKETTSSNSEFQSAFSIWIGAANLQIMTTTNTAYCLSGTGLDIASFSTNASL